MSDKFSKTQYSPALFDITQDIIGGLPLKVIGQWLESEQTHDVALQLLEPYKVRGYSVCSDSAGLTKLTKQKGLLEILAIINQPKEIVYAYGTAIGGQGVGIWAADNTQMFYPESVSADTLISALLTMQDEIMQRCQIRIGLGANYGEFYSLSGGLYGLEADTIEEIAENHTEGGEVAITQDIYEQFPSGHTFAVTKKGELVTKIGDIFRVTDGPRLSNIQAVDKNYPIPYSESFYADLLAYQDRLTDTAFGQELTGKYLVQKVVVLIERESKEAETHEVAMFNNLSLAALMKDVGMRLLPENNGVEIKVAGPIGIYVFDQANDALNFSRSFREELANGGVACRIGIDAGSVLLFDLAVGGKDIAGMPVNIASKMAQDKGEFGNFYLSSGMKEFVDVSQLTEIKYTVSGVEMVIYQG
ncbi:MAG TPA: family 3 adenylate cyclase [Cyanobacteria bacterium UBA12227]|nr:family 3 adenylate cyclase [Cyanobacteria bacterium UBA12227]HAX88535.1 family 3 adenylate cyclase [Cyanobacteria bacterium UBA11370]HBY76057.1 family 3 adenylate cyclase [Cyanobacteria bacterium UBA11148]